MNNVPYIEFVIDEIFRQSVKQFGIGRRIAFPHVVDFVDEPMPHEVSPQAIDEDSCEEWIVRLSHPVDERVSRIVLRSEFTVFAIKEFRLGHLARQRILLAGCYLG